MAGTDKTIKSNGGQLIVEAILLMTLLLAIFMAFSESLRRMEFLPSLFLRPWQSIAGMMESGVWKPPEEARRLHPNHLSRRLTVKGEEVR